MVLHRVAVAVLIGVLLFTTAFAISPAFREEVRNLVVSMTAESADLELVTSEAAVGSDLLSHYVFPDCPEGFELMEEGVSLVGLFSMIATKMLFTFLCLKVSKGLLVSIRKIQKTLRKFKLMALMHF